MKRFLRWALDFAERKFPDRLEVRVADLEAWKVRVAKLETDLAAANEKLTKMEVNLLNVNQAMGFAAPKFGGLER